MRRSIPERLLAWLYTGPLGHLWSPVADIVTLWSKWMLQRARDRLRGAQAMRTR